MRKKKGREMGNMKKKEDQKEGNGKSLILVNLFLSVGVTAYFFGMYIITQSGYTGFVGSVFSGFTLGIIVTTAGISIMIAMVILNITTIIGLIVQKSLRNRRNNKMIEKNNEI